MKSAYFLVGTDALYTLAGLILGLAISFGLFLSIFDLLI
jgi:hypothetical protein